MLYYCTHVHTCNVKHFQHFLLTLCEEHRSEAHQWCLSLEKWTLGQRLTLQQMMRQLEREGREGERESDSTLEQENMPCLLVA